MSRWINADEFLTDESEAYMKAQIELAKKNADKTIDATRYINQVVHKKIQMLIADTPSIDLVRCAECKNCKRKRTTFKGEPIFFYRCKEHNRDVESDDYCSWGERRE